MKTGIFYGSTTGTTAEVGQLIAKNLGVVPTDVHDVEKEGPAKVGEYDLLIFGASTHGDGDLQSEMEDFLAGVEPLDLRDKKIALFGCGDCTMADTFCDAVGEMYERLKGTGATFIGDFPAGCYEYNQTRAEIDGKIVGLLIDDVNHANLTPTRVEQWCELLKK